MSNMQTYSTPEELNIMLKDEERIREFSNYVIFEGMTKVDAWVTTFNVEKPLTPSYQTKMYRWVGSKSVTKWMTKANKSLEVDWIDKRVNALQHLYSLGTDKEQNGKTQVDALDKFLTHLNKEENKIKLDIGGQTQVNIVQIVQDKLSMITQGHTISPDGLIGKPNKSKGDEYMEKFMEAQVVNND